MASKTSTHPLGAVPVLTSLVVFDEKVALVSLPERTAGVPLVAKISFAVTPNHDGLKSEPLLSDL